MPGTIILEMNGKPVKTITPEDLDNLKSVQIVVGDTEKVLLL